MEGGNQVRGKKRGRRDKEEWEGGCTRRKEKGKKEEGGRNSWGRGLEKGGKERGEENRERMEMGGKRARESESESVYI